MTILKWFKNPIWLPSPRPRTGPGCRGRCHGCPGLHPRLPRTLAPGPGYHPRLPDTSPRPQTASKAAPDTSPRPRAPDIIQGCPGHYLWLLVTPTPNGPRISSKDCLPGLSCASTLFAATVIAVCIIVTSTSLTFTDVLYIWLLDGYTSGSMSLSCYSLAFI